LEFGKYGLSLLVLLVLAATSVKFGPRYVYQFLGHLRPEKFESYLTENQIKDIQKDLQGLKAKIIWSSSRTGNHETFLLTLPDLKMVQLNHNPHVGGVRRNSDGMAKVKFRRTEPLANQRE
jgi:hypothetical protein